MPAPNGLQSSPSLDVVVPFYNEEAALPRLLETLDHAFAPEPCMGSRLGRIRYVLVDDGSQDRSLETLRSLVPRSNRLLLLCLSRNFGHQAAITAGLTHSDSDLVAILDADLQDPPHLVHDMIGLWREGYDVVYGERRNRKENVLKRAAYETFYRLYRWPSPIEVPLNSGDFCLMSRRVVRASDQLPERLRFNRGLRSWVGFAQKSFPYDRPGRETGDSKYTLRKLYALATDGLAAMSITPLRLSQFFALLFFGLSGLVYVLFRWRWWRESRVAADAVRSVRNL